MAMRLATQYVKTCLQLTEAEMAMFIQMFVDHQASLQVKVLENGNQEVVFQDNESGEEIVLSFERKFNTYVCRGTCRITDKNLVNLMRKAVSTFKGSAIVHRIYEGYIMIYEYEWGSVVKIVERKDQTDRVIYEYKDTIGMLEQLYRRDDVEHEIQFIKAQINSLLDLRNDMQDTAVREQIDSRLYKMTHRLFVLEA
ncbi:non-ribosomal peptide synthetase module [Paenibacillus sp. H1-7]|uniref:non-ribosomal peptide synthetase module n=1 Tax=Paenibacillus sp. H1-7 TaxID=2282849 RepID=UPI001EF8B994|nr:non-ribosomal peptide synthetase module [Paenibacillus sp. H1-7]